MLVFPDTVGLFCLATLLSSRLVFARFFVFILKGSSHVADQKDMNVQKNENF